MIVSEVVPVGGFRSVASFGKGKSIWTGPKGGVNPFVCLEVVHNHGKNEIDIQYCLCEIGETIVFSELVKNDKIIKIFLW